jgi:hypothetical protein
MWLQWLAVAVLPEIDLTSIVSLVCHCPVTRRAMLMPGATSLRRLWTSWLVKEMFQELRPWLQGTITSWPGEQPVRASQSQSEPVRASQSQ